jgi:hypothetical protein
MQVQQQDCDLELGIALSLSLIEKTPAKKRKRGVWVFVFLSGCVECEEAGPKKKKVAVVVVVKQQQGKKAEVKRAAPPAKKREEPDNCPICLESDCDTIIAQCFHKIHRTCADRLSVHQQGGLGPCPVCKEPMEGFCLKTTFSCLPARP